MKRNYHRTDKKVEICNGMQTFTRTVYADDYGHEYFKYGGNLVLIYETENRFGKFFKAPYFNEVKYI